MSSDDNQGTDCPEPQWRQRHTLSHMILETFAEAAQPLLVHAIGEESFIDRNGNGIMDQDEQDLFENLPEAFLDNNEDGVYTPALPQCVAAPTGHCSVSRARRKSSSISIPTRLYDLNDDPAVYNGLLCPIEGDGVWCSRELVNVRAFHGCNAGRCAQFRIPAGA